jgi:hypothetical protein
MNWFWFLVPFARALVVAIPALLERVVPRYAYYDFLRFRCFELPAGRSRKSLAVARAAFVGTERGQSRSGSLASFTVAVSSLVRKG